jgi:hypothetical protein
MIINDSCEYNKYSEMNRQFCQVFLLLLGTLNLDIYSYQMLGTTHQAMQYHTLTDQNH